MPPGGGRRGQKYQKPKNAVGTLKRLMKYIARTPWPLIAVLVCLVVSVRANLYGTYMQRDMINNFLDPRGAGFGDIGGLSAAIVKLAGIYLIGALCSYGQSAIMVQLAQRGVNRLRKDLFDALQKLPLSYFDKHTHGELMSRFTNDADNVQMTLERSLVSLFSSCFMFVGLIYYMVRINWKLFLLTTVILAFTAVVFKNVGGKSRRYYQAQQAALGAVNGNIQEIIEGLKVVKAFTHEEQAKAEFEKLNNTYRDAAQKATFYGSIMGPVSSNLMTAGYAVTAVAGGILSVSQGFDLGGLITYLRYSRQVSQPLEQVSQQVTTILSALAGAERIFEVMDTAPERDEGTVTLVPAALDENGDLSQADSTRDLWAWKRPGEEALIQLKGAVRFTGVDFSYVPDKQVLHDVSVYANPGQKIAFVGSTGAGKTTITNLINRFYEIENGAITIDGINVQDIEKDSLRRTLGAVLQDTHLFTGTVMDNIRYGRLDATDEECIAAAKTVGAHSFIRRLPEGYNTMVTGDGANLSQGQRQLLAIARAAVADPPVMILDEATSSIDTRTEAQIQKGMDALMEGRTVFVIAHRLSTVRNADCIVVIENGTIMEKGSHAELLEQQGRYYQLYTGQFQLD